MDKLEISVEALIYLLKQEWYAGITNTLCTASDMRPDNIEFFSQLVKFAENRVKEENNSNYQGEQPIPSIFNQDVS